MSFADTIGRKGPNQAFIVKSGEQLRGQCKAALLSACPSSLAMTSDVAAELRRTIQTLPGNESFHLLQSPYEAAAGEPH